MAKQHVGAIGGQSDAYDMGQKAYLACKPKWCNPCVGELAAAWLRGYLEAQAAHGGHEYHELPPRKRGRTTPGLRMRSPRGGGRRTAAQMFHKARGGADPGAIRLQQ